MEPISYSRPGEIRASCISIYCLQLCIENTKNSGTLLLKCVDPDLCPGRSREARKDECSVAIMRTTQRAVRD